MLLLLLILGSTAITFHVDIVQVLTGGEILELLMYASVFFLPLLLVRVYCLDYTIEKLINTLTTQC